MISLPPTSRRRVMRTVGISDMGVSGDPNDVLVTYSLGSCVGLSLCDRSTGLAGLIHCMLPESSIDPERAQVKPLMFVDLGVPLLIRALLARGARPRSLVAKVAGGANIFDDGGRFRIGERNYTALRKVLWKNDLLIAAESVGGTRARTLYVCVASGRVFLRAGMEQVEL